MNKIKRQLGVTLLDLLLTLSIVSILGGIALPAFGKLIDRSKISAETTQLLSTLQLARKTAITNHQKVTICPSNDMIVCSDDWSEGYMVFIDINEDRELSANEMIIHQAKIQNKEIELRWKAFGVKSSMQWHQTGITNHQNGSFEFCFKQEPTLARALVITKAGRIRLSKDENNDGIHENARGESISC